MNNTNLDFSSRLSFRAVTGGIVTALGLMLLFTTLGAAISGWDLNLSDVRTASTGFWIWGFVAWDVSIFFGTRLAVAASRSPSFKDGLIHGVTTWAGSSIMGCFILATATGRLVNFSSLIGSGPLWISFFGNLLALGAAITAGKIGSFAEERAARIERHEVLRADETGIPRIPRTGS